MGEKPNEQIGTLVNPNRPASDERFPYYLLEEMHSPPISTPGAVRWKAYETPRQFLRSDDPHDTRVAYGFIEYDRRLSWQDLKKYNMLPFDYDESVLFDLWQSFGEDKGKLLAFFGYFFKAVNDDPGLRRLQLAIKLFSREWTLKRVRAEVRKINGKK